MSPTLLIDTATLQSRLGDPALRLFDTTVHLVPRPGGYDVRSGRADYVTEHIPGAGFLDLLEEFADTSHRLRFMMPPREQLIDAAGRLGIGPGTHVVLYNSGPTWWSTRAFFMFRAVGCDAVQVLDGGLERWRAEQRPLESGECHYPATRFEPGPSRDVFVDRAAVLDAVKRRDHVLMNALAPAVFRGEVVPYGRPGRIAGSVNLPATSLLDDERRFLHPAKLEARLAEAGALGDKPTITYCGGGISATTNAFALLLLGRTDVQIYDASMNEWGPDPTLPMESG
jgi:thiosulfate/3-mercaptopyruvate sulfurtransferase